MAESLFAIFGNPVSHSKSPQMQNSGFKYLNIDATYSKHHLEDGSKLKNEFITNNYKGANITVPHKEEAFKQADNVIGLANEIGAVNTYVKQKDGSINAYNTDAPGFMQAIEEFGNIKTAIIIGAGGTAKAIAIAFKDAGIDTTILNRSESRLNFFSNLKCKTYTWDNYPIDIKYDLVVNSTSAGLKDNNYPAPLNLTENIIENSSYAIDCIYGKVTPFLDLAKKHNLPNKDGEDMLLYQGVIAFELFTNTKADDKLVKAMREGLNK